MEGNSSLLIVANMTSRIDKMKDRSLLPQAGPFVSIYCITHNHASYIRDALECFLMQ